MSPQKLSVIVRYDLYPYFLVHEFVKMQENGDVTTNVGNFRQEGVIAIIPRDVGEKLYAAGDAARDAVNKVSKDTGRAELLKIAEQFPVFAEAAKKIAGEIK